MNALFWLTKDFRGIPRTFIALTEMLGLIWIDLGSIRSCFIGKCVALATALAGRLR